MIANFREEIVVKVYLILVRINPKIFVVKEKAEKAVLCFILRQIVLVLGGYVIIKDSKIDNKDNREINFLDLVKMVHDLDQMVKQVEDVCPQKIRSSFFHLASILVERFIVMVVMVVMVVVLVEIVLHEEKKYDTKVMVVKVVISL